MTYCNQDVKSTKSKDKPSSPREKRLAHKGSNSHTIPHPQDCSPAAREARRARERHISNSKSKQLWSRNAAAYKTIFQNCRRNEGILRQTQIKAVLQKVLSGANTLPGKGKEDPTTDRQARPGEGATRSDTLSRTSQLSREQRGKAII